MVIFTEGNIKKWRA